MAVHITNECLDDWTLYKVVHLNLLQAFNKVNNMLLLHKDSPVKNAGNPHKRVCIFLIDKTQCAVFCRATLSALPLVFCLPQSSVLGPTLNIIINDTPKSLQSTPFCTPTTLLSSNPFVTAFPTNISNNI